MGVISSNNFDPTRRYVGVRLQQGVPIVDRDWNEMEDIRKFELRTFLKWFIGDGVPSGVDAFKIDLPSSSTDANDFTIRAGIGATSPAGANDFDIGLYFEGYYLADGIGVFITSDTAFTSQPLHESQAGASVLATAWNVPTIKSIALPTPQNTALVVYLDVWDRLVPPTEDPTNLILPGLGTESCARTKREWAVRARPLPTSGGTVPAPGDSDYLSGHGYSALATIVSRTSSNIVNPGDITDLRQTRLTLANLLHADLVRRVGVLENLLLLPAFDPSPNQFTPTSGSVGQTITLHGRNFTVGKPRVLFGSVEATMIGATGATGTNAFRGFELTAMVPPGVPGNVKITVIITDGVTAVSTVMSDDTFTVLGVPVFGSPQFTPTSGTSGIAVIISGFNFDAPNLKVEFDFPDGTVIPATVSSSSATQIATTVPNPNGLYGNWRIRVTTDHGTALSDNTFTILPLPPAFAAPGSQFTPTSMSRINRVNVTLNGSNFDGPNLSVGLNKLDNTGTFTLTVLSASANQIVVSTANVSDATQYKFVVSTSGGSKTSDDIFTVIKEKETKEGKEGTKEKETKEHIKDKDAAEKTKDAAEKLPEVVRVEPTASGPTGLPAEVTERSGFGEQPPGQAFIAPAQRPDVGADVLKQADEEAGQQKGANG